MSNNKNVKPFERDARDRGGYVYTTNQSLSSRMATSRTTDLIRSVAGFAGKRVLDAGCGDGTFTQRFWDGDDMLAMVGIDASSGAIEVAHSNQGSRGIRYAVADAHVTPFASNSFDIVLLQSILHHDDAPLDLIREAFRLAPEVLIHEPNGNNPGVKLFERFSQYHREHGEKSYRTAQIARWVTECGGTVSLQKFAGFVPMFVPDRAARLAKLMEPAIENTPLLNRLGCAVVVIRATRS